MSDSFHGYLQRGSSLGLHASMCILLMPAAYLRGGPCTCSELSTGRLYDASLTGACLVLLPCPVWSELQHLCQLRASCRQRHCETTCRYSILSTCAPVACLSNYIACPAVWPHFSHCNPLQVNPMWSAAELRPCTPSCGQTPHSRALGSSHHPTRGRRLHTGSQQLPSSFRSPRLLPGGKGEPLVACQGIGEHLGASG